MIDFFISLNPILQALIATILTWLITLLGAALVFIFKSFNRNLMDSMLGFAAGIMIAASFFSLLSPAIDMANHLNMISWLVVALGFFCGGMLIFIGDEVFKHVNNVNKNNSMKRIVLLVFSITLHNIPEGLAVGVAFGSVYYNLDGTSLSNACLLALGIGLQNFPEGTAVSVPLRREGLSRKKSFFFGQLSAVVEPIFGVLGALLVLKVRLILPFLLSFAAGAMIYVVIQEIIPESQSNKNNEMISIFTLLGFTIMMILDIALN